MTRMFSRVLLAGLTAIALGCAESAPEMKQVRITGTAQLADGTVPAGTVHLRAYHAWSGAGELRHPLHEMGDFSGPAQGFSGVVQYDPAVGEGLIVHAWLDVDGDGVHCTPANRAEPAGLTVAETFPADEVAVSITLTENCAAANWFFPPRAP
jgi:hypothetical protein